MKKVLLASGIVLVLISGACNKKDEKKTSSGRDWTFNGQSHSADSVYTLGYTVAFEDKAGNYLYFFLYDMPLKEGVYDIVLLPDLQEGKASIAVYNISQMTTGLSDGEESRQLIVTMKDGKFHFKCDDVSLFTTNDLNNTEGTARFSTDISE